MGKFKEACITEQRVYDNPNDPSNSDYTITLPITVPDAVLDPDTGESLGVYLNNINQTMAGFNTQLNNKASLVKFEEHINMSDSLNKETQKELTSLRANMTSYEGRIMRLEESLYNELTENPWSAEFDSLDDFITQGFVWNKALARL